MKRFLFCLFVLTLSSCANIEVSDFGSYWAKGYVDPAFVGQWQMTTPKSNDDREEARSIKTAVPFTEVTSDYGTFHINSLVKEVRESKDYQPGIARILDVGKYKFFMSGQLKDIQGNQLKSGQMIRFAFDNGQFVSYDLNGKRMKAFLNANYPSNKNIEAGCAEWLKPTPAEMQIPTPEISDKDCHFFNTRVKKFDNSVYEILEKIPDTSEFWSLSKDYGFSLMGNRKK